MCRHQTGSTRRSCRQYTTGPQIIGPVISSKVDAYPRRVQAISISARTLGGARPKEDNVIALNEAYKRWISATRSGNSYNWYRQRAAEGGPVFGKAYAVKIGNRWMIDEHAVDAAIEEVRRRQAEIRAVTDDYQTKILHGASGDVIRLTWGGYRLKDDFHFVWNDHDVALMRSDGVCRCNRCFKVARHEFDNPECHVCADWRGCSGNCTLSRVYCGDCGTSLTFSTDRV